MDKGDSNFYFYYAYFLMKKLLYKVEISQPNGSDIRGNAFCFKVKNKMTSIKIKKYKLKQN